MARSLDIQQKKISKNKKKLVNPKINKDTKINHYKINKEEDQNMKFFINNNSNTIYKHKNSNYCLIW